jgi:cobaltochelatase CobN
MGHLYGQGFWGDKERHKGEDLSDTLMKKALSGTKMVVHSRSSNIYATLDNDDFFQYLGGTAMAVRALDGATPEVYVTSLANPKSPKQESLETAMGREMRARYLNPEWIKAMMKEGYGGARFVDKVMEHLWGWQVTVPEAVDAAKWNEMYETYVLDRNGLDIKEQFRKAGNLHAYQSLVARMLETVRKNYWKPDDAVVQTLAAEYARTVNEVGLACSENTCNNRQLSALTASTLLSVPALKPLHRGFTKALAAVKGTAGETRPTVNREGGAQVAGRSTPSSRAPGGKAAGETVEGYEMQEAGMPASGAPRTSVPYLFLIGFAVLVALMLIGFRRRR